MRIANSVYEVFVDDGGLTSCLATIGLLDIGNAREYKDVVWLLLYIRIPLYAGTICYILVPSAYGVPQG